MAIILKSNHCTIKCEEIRKISKNDREMPAVKEFRWLLWKEVEVKPKYDIFEIKVSYIPTRGEKETLYTIQCDSRGGRDTLYEEFVKSWTKQDPEVNWLDKAVEDAVLT